ncbi:acyl-CoA desaturase [Lignipirellula cremea]|uniref:Fatty acid desaturase n=1 Tax=Lignipirellula cremea TaxID=2528010 RepID=A0A518DU01_9BACT|nr:fatty acid desaturase [Lignipirellula cremea]QDU95315.1 Fatty acid desaturase [Lignipirellula cremea]
MNTDSAINVAENGKPAMRQAHATASSRTHEPQHTSLSQKEPVQQPQAERYPQGIDWYVMGWVVILHMGALAAPFFFTWQAVVVALVMHWITGGIGICLGYHRLFTHGSFRTFRPVQWAIASIGGLAGEGSILNWVADHRKHHAHSDQEGDPHSPREGLAWSHILWLARAYTPEQLATHHRRWAPDLLKDPVLMFIGRMFLPMQIAFGLAMLGIGYAIGGFYFGMSLLTWGVFLRLVGVMHSTWFVNSASHVWGYVNYKTTDDSKNNWWVALVTYGEGWHNNHHAYPRMANHGHRWWEIDVTFWAIRTMQCLGIAWDVVDYKKKSDSLAKTSVQQVEEAETDKLAWNRGELQAEVEVQPTPEPANL